MEGLTLRSRIATDEERALSGRRPMWRRVVDQETGEVMAVKDPPNWPRQEGTVLVDPNREYNLKLWGVTDPFEESKDFGNGPVVSTKFIFEFAITNSAKWGGVILMGYYRVPKDWGDPRAELAELAFALEGHRLGDDEDFDIRKHLLAETRFKAWIVQEKAKQSGKLFNKMERRYPIATVDADDFIPDGGVSLQGRAASPIDVIANAVSGVPVAAGVGAAYNADGVPADFVPDDIPF
jgi:hypothetical protein